jgi:hypothetical protein
MLSKDEGARRPSAMLQGEDVNSARQALRRVRLSWDGEVTGKLDDCRELGSSGRLGGATSQAGAGQ